LLYMAMIDIWYFLCILVVVSDGLGVAYSTNSNVLLYNVTSGRGWSKQFCQEIEQALLDMCLLCSSTNGSSM
jgi:hypothetical protein